MDKIRIRGGRPLHGSLTVGGAKNAALPLMAASLLTDETLTLAQVPHLADIATMANLLAQHGVVIRHGRLGRPGRRRRPRARTDGRHITAPRPPMTWSARCAPACWCWGRWSRAAARPRCRCRAAAPSAPARSTCTSRACGQLGAADRAERRLHPGAAPQRAARRPDRLPDRLGRRHREPADGGRPGQGRDRAGQRRARAGSRPTSPRCLIAMGAQIEGIGTDTLPHPGRGPAARRLPHASSPTGSRPAPTSWPPRSPAAMCELINGRLEHVAGRGQGPERRRRRASTETERGFRVRARQRRR